MIGPIGPTIIYLLCAFSAVICDIQRFEDGTFIADFTIINRGQMQYPSLMMFIESLTLNECTEYCIKHLDCVTFNYNLKTRACELVDQNFDEYEALDEDPHWYNYGTPDKIDGGWSTWMNASCTVTCGNGTLTQYRTCTAPEPKYGDKPCDGNEVQTVRCEMDPCPIDGGLSDWLEDGKCSVTCGGGTLNLIKTCTNPPPQHGGKDCTAKPKRTAKCNTQQCPCVKTTFGNCCQFPFYFRTRYHHNCVFDAAHRGHICKDARGKIRICVT